MIPYTTPTYTLTIEGVDLSQYSVLVTFRQGSKTVTIEDAVVTSDGTDTTITATMTQAQSALFTVGTMEVQVNWLNGSHRDATISKAIAVDRQLLKEVK